MTTQPNAQMEDRFTLRIQPFLYCCYKGKAVPCLLLPSIQVNLNAGERGKT